MDKFKDYSPNELHMRRLMVQLAEAVDKVRKEKVADNQALTPGHAFLDLKRDIYVGVQYTLTEEQRQLMDIKA